MADTDKNVIPSLYAAGQFTAITPFTTVVDESIFYKVEDVCTAAQFRNRNIDVWGLMFEPVGISEDAYESILDLVEENNGAIITLTSKNGSPVYIPSTYIKSFPLIDGVIFERFVVYTDLGACPPQMADKINTLIDHFQDYAKTNFGLVNAKSYIGSIPTRAYVSKEDAEIFESTRLNAIANAETDQIKLARQAETITKQQLYIQELEAALIAAKNEQTP